MKKVLTSIFIIIFVLSMFSVVNAASASISVGASSQKVKVGDVFTVTVIGNADENISALQANISYDTNKLLLENRTVGTGFADFSGDNEIATAASNSDAISKTATLYTLTFKVLDTATVGETKIDFKNVSLALVNTNSTQEAVNVADESLTVTVEKAEETPDVKDEDNNDAKEENNTNKEDDKLPQTGIESASIILLSILAVIAVVSYVSYNKYRNI